MQHRPRGNGPTRDTLIGLSRLCGIRQGSAGEKGWTPLPAARNTVTLAAAHGSCGAASAERPSCRSGWGGSACGRRWESVASSGVSSPKPRSAAAPAPWARSSRHGANAEGMVLARGEVRAARA